MKLQHRTVLRGRQRGAALVVGLILLMVITLLAISGMNTATVELQMAGNMQFAQNAFQAAETGIERTVSLIMSRPDNPMPTLPNQGLAGAPEDDKFAAETSLGKVSSVSNVPGGGFSMGEGEGVGLKAYHYDVTSTGTSARNARSVNTQSVYIVAR
jgi:type IV pilus assembly protein PilX